MSRSNTTLTIRNRTIIFVNVSFNDHLEIWKEVLSGFPPQAIEYLIKLEFDADMEYNDSLMEHKMEKYKKILSEIMGISGLHAG